MSEAIHHDAPLEEIILKAKEGFGHIMPSQLWLESNPTAQAFGEAARDILLSFELIEKVENEKFYRLTKKGWLFESFASEKKIYKRERYVIHHAYWRAKLWWLIAIASFALGLLTKIVNDL